MDKKDKQFVSYLKYAGLGNRINSLVGDLFLFDTYYSNSSKQFNIYWPIIKDRFEELFDLVFENDKWEINVIDTIDKTKFFFDAKICENNKYIKNPNGFTTLISDRSLLQGINSYYHLFDNTIYYSYDKTPDIFIKRYLKYLNMLVPKKNITKIVNDYWNNVCANGYSMNNIVGVHIRRGDFDKYKERRVDINRFINTMKQIKNNNPSVVFYLSTDCDKTYQLIENTFNSKNVITFEHAQDSKEHSDFKTALICLLILSKCKHLVLTNFSTYSQLAWWLGGCNASVDIITNQVQDSLNSQPV